MTCCPHQPWQHSTQTYPRFHRPCEALVCCNQPERYHDHGHAPRHCPCDDLVIAAPAPQQGDDAAVRLAVCKWLRDRIKVWEDQAKADLAMQPGERKSAMVGGLPLGFVTLTQGRKTVKVVDEAGLLAFVAEHYPTELEQSVRPAFRDKLLDQFKRLGALTDPDGVVVEGLIATVEGQPYPMTKLQPDADQTMADFLAAGRLGIDGPTNTTNTTEGIGK